MHDAPVVLCGDAPKLRAKPGASELGSPAADAQRDINAFIEEVMNLMPTEQVVAANE